MMDDVQILPMSVDDVLFFYKSGLSRMARGWSVFLNGELVAICGVTIGRTNVIAFSKVRDGLDVPKITVWRVARKLMRLLAGMGIKSFYAIACPNTPGSVEFLKRLGLNHVESSVRGDIFQWQTQ